MFSTLCLCSEVGDIQRERKRGREKNTGGYSQDMLRYDPLDMSAHYDNKLLITAVEIYFFNQMGTRIVLI